MFDLNSTGHQHLLVHTNDGFFSTPRARTWNMRSSFNSVRGAKIIAVMFLYCSPWAVRGWFSDLQTRHWINEPVDILVVRKSRLPGKVDAVMVVNRQAGQWRRFIHREDIKMLLACKDDLVKITDNIDRIFAKWNVRITGGVVLQNNWLDLTAECTAVPPRSNPVVFQTMKNLCVNSIKFTVTTGC